MDYHADGPPTRRALVYNPHNAADVIYVPRVLPAWTKFAPFLHELSETHGLSISANGRIAFQSMRVQLLESAKETCRMLDMTMPELQASGVPLKSALQTDAARRRTRQFLPCVLKNKAIDSQSCFALRLLGLGIRYKDDKYGFESVLQPNIECIEECLRMREVSVGTDAAGADLRFKIELRLTGDAAGVQAIEGQMCGCPREAIHEVPSMSDMATLEALKATISKCDNKTASDVRRIRSHTPLKGEKLPRPCDCCAFGHDPAKAEAEHAALIKRLTELKHDTSDAGKRALQTFNRAHKHRHKNVGPGPDGIVPAPLPPPARARARSHHTNTHTHHRILFFSMAPFDLRRLRFPRKLERCKGAELEDTSRTGDCHHISLTTICVCLLARARARARARHPYACCLQVRHCCRQDSSTGSLTCYTLT